MITFRTDVQVPKETIRQIERTITDNVMKSKYLFYFSSGELETVNMALQQAFEVLTKSPVLNADWELPEKTVLEIANSLRSGKRIFAIKEFRTATGADLREARNIIDQFPLDNRGGKLFIMTFIKN